MDAFPELLAKKTAISVPYSDYELDNISIEILTEEEIEKEAEESKKEWERHKHPFDKYRILDYKSVFKTRLAQAIISKQTYTATLDDIVEYVYEMKKSNKKWIPFPSSRYISYRESAKNLYSDDAIRAALSKRYIYKCEDANIMKIDLAKFLYQTMLNEGIRDFKLEKIYALKFKDFESSIDGSGTLASEREKRSSIDGSGTLASEREERSSIRYSDDELRLRFANFLIKRLCSRLDKRCELESKIEYINDEINEIVNQANELFKD